MANKKEQTERVELWTPPGRFSYPYFAEVDSGRDFSDEAYKTDLIIPKAIFKEKGKALQEAVLKVGREFHGDEYSLKSDDWHSPFKDTDLDDTIENDAIKGSILIRAKSAPRKKNGVIKAAIQPSFIGPRKNADGKFETLSKEEIEAIKGGDWGKLLVVVFAFKGSKTVTPGVSFFLQAVQFWKEGEAFGQGRSKAVQTAEELEEEEAEEPSEDESPKKSSKVVEDDEDDTPAPKRGRPKKVAAAADEDDDDDVL